MISILDKDPLPTSLQLLRELGARVTGAQVEAELTKHFPTVLGLGATLVL